MNQLRRVGHKGADLIAPGNTLPSFDAALSAGVDMIEFDVLPDRERLILAHDYEDADGRSPHTLEEGLAHLATERFAGIELDVDLKRRGYELRVLEALRSFGLLERAMISSQHRSSLRLIRQIEPCMRLGWSVPKLRHDPFRHRVAVLPALIALLALRAVLPRWAAAELSKRRCDALMVHWRLVTPHLVRRVAAAGGELYVWTVDEIPRLRALKELGVTGVITNDPRLFAALA
jgi:glycerophosphoryl diester phosphodiesterase